MERYTYKSQKHKSGLKIFKYTASSGMKAGKKILVLSDLHIFSENDLENMDIIIMELKETHYDYVFLDGDIMDQTAMLRDNEFMTNKLLWFIASLGQITPTYIVYGCHDQAFYSLNYNKYFGTPWIDGSELFKSRFDDKVRGLEGVHVLDNKTESLGDGYTVSGIIPDISYVTEDSNGTFNKVLDVTDLSFLKSLDRNDINILLCHYPNIIFDLYRQGFLHDIDLGISGHNHNGCTQLRVFPVEKIFDLLGWKNRGFVTPSMSIKPKNTETLRGVVELNGKANLVISPCIKTFSATGGKLELLDRLFYKGATSIEYVPEKEFVMTKKWFEHK